MTHDETKAALMILRDVYPSFQKDADPATAKRVVDLWASLFADDSAALVGAAVRAFIVTDEKGFPPTPGQIKAKMRELSGTQDALSAADAWTLVSKALKNSTWGAADEFAGLPPAVQRAVGNPDQLRTWGQMSSETVHSVVMSLFVREYNRIAEAERQYQALPDDIRAIAAHTQPELPGHVHTPDNPANRTQNPDFPGESAHTADSPAERERLRRRIAAIVKQFRTDTPDAATSADKLPDWRGQHRQSAYIPQNMDAKRRAAMEIIWALREPEPMSGTEV